MVIIAHQNRPLTLGWISLSVLLNVSYDKEHDYTWFRGWDLNGFRDIKPFMKLMVGEIPGHSPGEHPT